MPRIRYVDRNFSASSRALIKTAGKIIAEFANQGYDLTLRQLYYQFVSRAIITNTERSYKRLGSIVNDARLTGLIDWHAIIDRTRFLRKQPDWETPSDIVHGAARQYKIDRWANQDYRLEVWIEKDALIGVISRVCDRWRVPYFSCRGYVSQSEMWRASQRMKMHVKERKDVIVIHLGDHDPSGMDMTRDIDDRLELFTNGAVEIERIALNMDQVQEYGPPPNPAKLTDARCHKYIAEYGSSSWELDALEPRVMSELIESTIKKYVYVDAWKESGDREEDERTKITALADSM